MVIAEQATQITARDVARIHELRGLTETLSDSWSEAQNEIATLLHTDLQRCEKLLERGAKLWASPTSEIKRLGAEIQVLRAQVEQRKYERRLDKIEELIEKAKLSLSELRMRGVMADVLDNCPE
jgi:chromosome segregation ATPase